ncbi:hypothetical protein [Aquimarina litoralis]|uniref:hypothetical protein n=1 Tax=Aquimarina litoralis TaxID=584605 RepID=UPI001C56528A|nr:hypothetical protein [Aquimarina litoralis]MBW1296425.1 hypothetical protein [Aquimarina litoralis]
MSKNIFIYPVVFATKKYKIVIERNGIITKKGNEIYPQYSFIDKKTKERIPSVYEKIHQLYEELAFKILSKINNENQTVYGNE